MTNPSTILRARFPKPVPREERANGGTFRYPSGGYRGHSTPLPPLGLKWDRTWDKATAFQPDNLNGIFGLSGEEDTWDTLDDERFRKKASGAARLPSDLVTVYGFRTGAADKPVGKKTFVAEAGERSPAADAHAASLRGMGLKIVWDRKSSAPAEAAKIIQASEPSDFTGLPGHMLRRPCKTCPFSPTGDRTKMGGPGVAAELADEAYRFGFSCQERAHPGQSCAGASMMLLQEGCSAPWPGIKNNSELAEKLVDKIDWTAQHYKSTANFVRANTVRKK